MPTKKKAPVRRESTMTTRAMNKADKDAKVAKRSALSDVSTARAAGRTPTKGGMTKKADAQAKKSATTANRLKSIQKTEADARRKAKLAGEKSKQTQRRKKNEEYYGIF